MRRSITLISVAVTAFAVVILASVVYGMSVSARTPSAATASTQAFVPAANVLPQPSPELVAASVFSSPKISPRQAVTLASEFLSRTDPYSVQLSEYNGVQAYKVAFSSGDVVYVGLNGQVLGSVPANTLVAKKDREREEGGGRHADDSHETDDHGSDDGGDAGG